MAKLDFSIRNKLITNYLNTDFPTIPQSAPTKANAQNVSYTPYPTGEKHTISTFVDQTHIQLTRQHRKKTSFFKTSLTVQFSTVQLLAANLPKVDRRCVYIFSKELFYKYAGKIIKHKHFAVRAGTLKIFNYLA